MSRPIFATEPLRDLQAYGADAGWRKSCRSLVSKDRGNTRGFEKRLCETSLAEVLIAAKRCHGA